MLAESRHSGQLVGPSTLPDISDRQVGINPHMAVMLWDEAGQLGSCMRACDRAAYCFEKLGADDQ